MRFEEQLRCACTFRSNIGGEFEFGQKWKNVKTSKLCLVSMMFETT